MNATNSRFGVDSLNYWEKVSITTMVGFFATATSVAFIWPQVVRVFVKNSTEGISPLSFLQGCCGSTMWTIYGISKPEGQVALSNGLFNHADGLVHGCNRRTGDNSASCARISNRASLRSVSGDVRAVIFLLFDLVHLWCNDRRLVCFVAKCRRNTGRILYLDSCSQITQKIYCAR